MRVLISIEVTLKLEIKIYKSIMDDEQGMRSNEARL